MNLSLLNFIKCVDCENVDLTPHTLEANSRGQIIYEYIICGACNSVFPIINGVPIFFKKTVIAKYLLPLKIEIIHSYSIPLLLNQKTQSGFIEKQIESHKNWSFQWMEMDTDTYENDWGKPFGSSEQFHYYDIPIQPEVYNNKTICEASCGFGRVIKILHDRPSRYIAFDLSGAVYKAIKLFPESVKLDTIRADMLSPPFKSNVFDIVFSPRAIHHTGNMELALRRLLPLIKSDGIMSFSVYSRENNFLMWGFIEPFKRFVNKYIPRFAMLIISIMLASIVWVTIHIFYKPLNMLGITFLSLNNFFMLWSKFTIKTLTTNIFDLLHAPYAEYISASQIDKWGKELGLRKIRMKLPRHSMGICGTAHLSKIGLERVPIMAKEKVDKHGLYENPLNPHLLKGGKGGFQCFVEPAPGHGG